MNTEQIAEIGIEALKESKRVHDELGEDGLMTVPSPNQFGETALRADIEAEQAVLGVLRKHSFPIRIISEEHGITNITENPIYLGILDGIDGTSVYKRARNVGRYATMFGIANGLNPKYKDYLFSGIIEHSADILWYATRNHGAFLRSKYLARRLYTATESILSEHTKIYAVEDYNELSRRMFKGKFSDFWTKPPLSAAISYVDIASGMADLEAEVTRKQNLEQMIAYGLVREAGGVMVDINGKDIGPQKYLEFGQSESVPLITAANQRLALSFLDFLN